MFQKKIGNGPRSSGDNTVAACKSCIATEYRLYISGLEEQHKRAFGGEQSLLTGSAPGVGGRFDSPMASGRRNGARIHPGDRTSGALFALAPARRRRIAIACEQLWQVYRAELQVLSRLGPCRASSASRRLIACCLRFWESPSRARSAHPLRPGADCPPTTAAARSSTHRSLALPRRWRTRAVPQRPFIALPRNSLPGTPARASDTDSFPADDIGLGDARAPPSADPGSFRNPNSVSITGRSGGVRSYLAYAIE